MKPVLVKEACRKVDDPQVLINIVSKRVRQLGEGGRPMIDPEARMGLADIALKEVAEGKLNFEPAAKPAAPTKG